MLSVFWDASKYIRFLFALNVFAGKRKNARRVNEGVLCSQKDCRAATWRPLASNDLTYLIWHSSRFNSNALLGSKLVLPKVRPV